MHWMNALLDSVALPDFVSQPEEAIAGQREQFQIYRQATMLCSLRQYLASLLPELA